MALPAHTAIVLKGCFGSTSAPVEKWSCSLRATAGPTSATTAAWQVIANAVGAAWGSNMAQNYSPAVVLQQVRVVRIAPTGHYVTRSDGSYELGDANFTIAGSSTQAAGGVLPLQTALVASLVTARSGATGKGRVFLPWPDKWGLNTGTYVLDPGVTPVVATRFAAFINGVNRALSGLAATGSDSPAVRVEVVSSKGYSSVITGVKIGNVADTQRSRRGAMVEVYAPAALPQ